VEEKELEKEIAAMADRIERLRSSKPAHDFTGSYEMELLQLEEQLDEKREKLNKSARRAGASKPRDDEQEVEREYRSL